MDLLVLLKVTQLCPTLCDHMDYIVHGILQAEYWSAELFSSSGDCPNPGIEPGSPALQADFFISRATREAQEYWSG